MGWILIPQIVFIAFRKRLFDIVDTRKVHVGIIPRLGGISFVPTQCCLIILSIFFMHRFRIGSSSIITVLPFFLALICGLVILFMTGIKDDLIGVNYHWKFFIQILVALLFPLSGLWINNMYGVCGIIALPSWVGMPLTIFFVVFIINAINLIDGIDGLCSGLTAIGCFIIGGLFAYSGAWLHASYAFITAGILLPFFYCNVFGISKCKQRIFMGDTGSLTLGLSVAFLIVSYAMYNPDIKPFSDGAVIVAFAIFIIPMFDVIRVIFVRLYNHKSIFLPDRNHIHHRFLRLGFSNRATMIIILLMALFFSFLNIVGVEYVNNNVLLFLDVVLWVITQAWFDRGEKKRL